MSVKRIKVYSCCNRMSKNDRYHAHKRFLWIGPHFDPGTLKSFYNQRRHFCKQMLNINLFDKLGTTRSSWSWNNRKAVFLSGLSKDTLERFQFY